MFVKIEELDIFCNLMMSIDDVTKKVHNFVVDMNVLVKNNKQLKGIELYKKLGEYGFCSVYPGHIFVEKETDNRYLTYKEETIRIAGCSEPIPQILIYRSHVLPD